MKTFFIRLPRPLVFAIIILIALTSLLTLHYYLLDKDSAEALAPALFGKSVVIDPGHGGWDPGVKGATGSREADVNLEIALKLAEYCRESGAVVTMIRESDIALADTKAVDMAARVDIASQMAADIFISVHCNSYPGQRGAQVFYEKGNEQGKALAEAIQNSIRTNLDNTDRKALVHADAYLLHQIDGAAVICETGFLSNKEEEALLKDNAYQWEMAWAIFTGMVDYLSYEQTVSGGNT